MGAGCSQLDDDDDDDDAVESSPSIVLSTVTYQDSSHRYQKEHPLHTAYAAQA